MESKIVYFAKPGRKNTEEVLRIVRQRAEELGIKTIVVASDSGDTAVKAVEAFSGLKVVVVSYCAGSREPNIQEFTEENRRIVENRGATILHTTCAFGGLSRAICNKHNMYLPGEIVADTLRILGQGMKVTCEIALMAADNGLAHTDEDVISIAGTGRGADTAVLLTPVNTHNFFDLKVKEILCKPHF